MWKSLRAQRWILGAQWSQRWCCCLENVHRLQAGLGLTVRAPLSDWRQERQNGNGLENWACIRCIRRAFGKRKFRAHFISCHAMSFLTGCAHVRITRDLSQQQLKCRKTYEREWPASGRAQIKRTELLDSFSDTSTVWTSDCESGVHSLNDPMMPKSHANLGNTLGTQEHKN
jgi:hypothetical protein